jgi:phosphatidylethanolamine/phosphatidyl-N-methylethanolamine N-methyltransferase
MSTERASPNDADRAYWERHASRYDASFKALDRPLPRMLELTAQAVRGCERVLEVAAGTGLVSAALAPVVGELVATDYAANMVARLQRRMTELQLGNVRCEAADIYALRFDAARFDAVVAANVLHLVPDLPGALASLRRVLEPGGKLIAPTFLHDETKLSRLLSRLLALTGFPGHRRLSAASLRRALEDAGFTIERAETIPGPFPIGFVAGRV